MSSDRSDITPSPCLPPTPASPDATPAGARLRQEPTLFPRQGGLVFFGDDVGEFEAVDARTGKALWHFNTGQRMHASPMSYAVDGVQYVSIAVGSGLFSFALGF